MELNKKILLVSHTLLEKIKWYNEAPNVPHKKIEGQTYKTQALLELVDFLNRKKGLPMSIEAQQGITFEKSVYDVVSKGEEKGSEYFKSITKDLKGFTFQKYVQKEFEWEDNYILRLYGFVDAIKDNCIIDIKTTANYKSGKYLNSTQHKIYCICTGATKFIYKIVEWKAFPVILKVYEEVFVTTKEQVKTLNLIKGIIDLSFKQLKTMQLWDTYLNIYCNK